MQTHVAGFQVATNNSGDRLAKGKGAKGILILARLFGGRRKREQNENR